MKTVHIDKFLVSAEIWPGLVDFPNIVIQWHLISENSLQVAGLLCKIVMCLTKLFSLVLLRGTAPEILNEDFCIIFNAKEANINFFFTRVFYD